MSARIKSEPLDDDDDDMELDHNNNIDDSSDDEDDEVVREFDVYLSPHLSSQQQLLHMMQYPLIKVHHSQQQQSSKKESSQQQQQQQQPSLPTPTTAKMRPRHCEIELEYSMPEDLQFSGGPFSMANRKYTSHTIPITSHLALGKMITSNDHSQQQPEGLHLVPLARILQMKPSFAHVDEAALLAMATTDDEIKREAAAAAQQQQQLLQDSSTNPRERQLVGIRKRESDRSIIQRKSSYAYKKQSHENELWQSLDVSGPDETDAQQIIQHDIICSDPTQNLLLVKKGDKDNNKAVNNNNNGANGDYNTNDSNATYLQSLNYLTQPTKVLYEEHSSENNNDDELSNVCTKLVEMMGQGRPMPYVIIRSQFTQQQQQSSGVKDEMIFTALATVSYLVDGNFIINSKYLPLTSKVAEARTFILLLLQTFKVVHRGHLQRVFCRIEDVNNKQGHHHEPVIPSVASAPSIISSNNDRRNGGDNDDKEYVPPEALNMVLKQVAQQTPDGWILKVEEDTRFPNEYPHVAQPHLEFWVKQIQHFRNELEIYHQYQGWVV